MRQHSPLLLSRFAREAKGQLLYRALYRRIRESILAGALSPGTRLPSTRSLAEEARVSRKTAEEAYASLEREGFIVRRGGSGSFVADVPSTGVRKPTLRGERRLSSRARRIVSSASCAEPQIIRAFAAGLPALDQFPLDLWKRTVAQCARRFDVASMIYGDPAGLPALREAVASYLVTSRGVRCDASQVIVLGSAQQGLDLAARLLLDPGDEVWCEDPAYYGAHAAFTAAGARLVPVPVDGDGLDVAAGMRLAPTARVACVTPSNHYPLGMTMSLERRLELLEWARRSNAWVIEDDYDGEFRYDGRPLSALQGIDGDGRVLYIGTFTKTLFPSLRLAYLVVPSDLVEGFRNGRTQVDGHTNTFMQQVVASFLESGHFAGHVRRMRTLYEARRDVLLDALGRRLRDRIEISSSTAGLRLSVFTRTPDRRIAERAAEEGIDLLPLSRLYSGKARRNGLVLGYAALTPAEIISGVETLRAIV